MASLGLPPRQAIPAMVDTLQFIIPSSVNTSVRLGENGQPIDLYERHPIPEALDAFMMQTPMLEATGQPSFAKLVNALLEYGNWWQFTALDGWDRSVMKNELFRPYNIGNNMDFLLKDRNRPVAVVTINREPNSASFSPPATDDISTPWCIMRVSAHAMDDRKTIVFSLQRYLPIDILRLRNVAQAPLSPSERRVSYLMHSELDNQEIAGAVGVTEATMREYSKRISAKLDASNRDGIRAGLSRMMPVTPNKPNLAW